jgi:hypothetical protein
MLGIKPRAMHRLSLCSTKELYTQSQRPFSKIKYYHNTTLSYVKLNDSNPPVLSNNTPNIQSVFVFL